MQCCMSLHNVTSYASLEVESGNALSGPQRAILVYVFITH